MWQGACDDNPFARRNSQRLGRIGLEIGRFRKFPRCPQRSAPAHRPLPPMPLSELPMMKALIELTGRRMTRNPLQAKGKLKTQLTTLRLTIIDKLQVLALRRPGADSDHRAGARCSSTNN